MYTTSKRSNGLSSIHRLTAFIAFVVCVLNAMAYANGQPVDVFLMIGCGIWAITGLASIGL